MQKHRIGFANGMVEHDDARTQSCIVNPASTLQEPGIDQHLDVANNRSAQRDVAAPR